MKNIDYRTNRHACYLLKYNLVVTSKHGCSVLVGDLKDCLLGIVFDLFEKQWKCKVLSITVEKNYIHILFEAPPHVQLSKLANNFKTVTSRLLRKKFPDFLSKYYDTDDKPYFWNRSYFICTDSEDSNVIIEQYIKNQITDD